MILNLWRHKAIEHGEGYDEDFLLYILTEQNHELLEKVKKLEEVIWKQKMKGTNYYIQSSTTQTQTLC